MTMRKLLWGMTWRGSLGGLIAGTVLGAIYGTLVAMVSGVPESLFQFFAPPFKVAFHPIGIVLGILLGGSLGGSVGLILGVLGGLGLGILMCLLSQRFANPKQIQRAVGMVCALYGIGGGLVGFDLAYRNILSHNLCYPYHCDFNIPSFTWLIVFPALIAGLGTTLVSQILTHWYERESVKEITQNVPPS